MMRARHSSAAILLLALAMPAGAQSAKDKVAAALAGAAPGKAAQPPRLDHNNIDPVRPVCSYLTRPMVRADGGGLNRHLAGSFVCHQGVAKLCEGPRWNPRGPCANYPGIRSAEYIEGSEPVADGTNGDAAGGDAAGNGSAQMRRDDGDGASGDGTTLLGHSPSEDNLQALQQSLQRTGGGAPGAGEVGRGGAGTTGASTLFNRGRAAAPADNAAECAQARTALTQIDEKLKAFRDLGQATTSDGSINSYAKEPYRQLQEMRQQVTARLAQKGCN
jgi:hypothetical protein